jgi:hypothetical protein
MDKDGFIIGLAMVERAAKAEGTPLFIYQNSSRAALKEPAELQPGDRTTLPGTATVISRYPKL